MLQEMKQAFQKFETMSLTEFVGLSIIDLVMKLVEF